MTTNVRSYVYIYHKITDIIVIVSEVIFEVITLVS